MPAHKHDRPRSKPSFNKVIVLSLTLVLSFIALACTQCVTGVTRIEMVGFDPSEQYFQLQEVPLDEVYLRITFDDYTEHRKYLSDPSIVIRGSIKPDLSLDTTQIGEDFIVHIYYAGFSYHIHYDVIAPGIIVRNGESIQAAIDASEPGDLILVEAGTYEESLVIPEDKTGIVLRSMSGADETIVRNVDVEMEPVTLRIQADDVVIEGFTFTKDESKSHLDEVGILLDGVEGVLILSNKLINSSLSLTSIAIKLDGSSYNDIKDNHVSFFDTGVLLSYSEDYGHSSYNEASGNSIYNGRLGIGIHTSSNVSNGVMTGNVIRDNHIVSSVIQDSLGIKLTYTGHIHDFIIESNLMEGLARGIVFREMASFSFHRNRINSNKLLNIRSKGFDFHEISGEENQFHDNFIDGNYNLESTGMLFHKLEGPNNTIRENTILRTSIGVEFRTISNLLEHQFALNSFIDISSYSLQTWHFLQTDHLKINANYNYWGSPDGPVGKIHVVQGQVIADVWYIDEDFTETNDD